MDDQRRASWWPTAKAIREANDPRREPKPDWSWIGAAISSAGDDATDVLLELALDAAWRAYVANESSADPLGVAQASEAGYSCGPGGSGDKQPTTRVWPDGPAGSVIMPGDPDPITGLTDIEAQQWIVKFLGAMHEVPETADAKLTRVQEMIPAALERARALHPDGDAAEHFRRGYQTRDAEVADLTRERDEDRAEVERLKAIIQAPHAWDPGERQRARLAMDVAASALESEHAYDGEAIVRALREALDEDTPDEFLPPWVTLGSPLKLFIDVPGDDAQIVQHVVVKSIVEAAGTPYAFVVRCEPFDEPLPSLDKLVGDVRFHVTSVSGMTALYALVERLMGVVAGADEEGAPIPREGMDVVFEELERAERTLRPRERGGVKVSPNEAGMFLDVARRFGADVATSEYREQHPSDQPKGSCDECWGLSFHRDECSQDDGLPRPAARPWQVGDLVTYQLSGKPVFGRVINVRDDGSVEVSEREPTTTQFGREWLISGGNLNLLTLVARPWMVGDMGRCPAPERPERTLTVCVTGLVGDGHVKLRERSGGPEFLLPVERLTRLEES